MTRIILVTNCGDCPHWQLPRHAANHWCVKMDRQHGSVYKNHDAEFDDGEPPEIPDWCPLEKEGTELAAAKERIEDLECALEATRDY